MKRSEAVNELETAKQRVKLQAQTKIIKTKAKNKHCEILNSNRFEAKTEGIIWILHYWPVRSSLEEKELSLSRSTPSFDPAKLFIFLPSFGSQKRSVIFHVALEKKIRAEFSFVINITFSINIFSNWAKTGGQESLRTGKETFAKKKRKEKGIKFHMCFCWTEFSTLSTAILFRFKGFASFSKEVFFRFRSQ